ncbi:hypothetical protein BVY03_02175 [bacterium K02(2017)]|nr:hypothetical protein BVY03_02175 [bacterium K02(2017)]
MDKIAEIQNLISEKMPGAMVRASDLTGNVDNLHLGVLVVSDDFKGKMLLEQHRMVMTILNERFKEDVHAVQLKTMTPEQYEQHQNEGAN